jgi:hypothetical protein
LKELLHSQLVTQERSGRSLIYRPQLDHMNALLDYLTAHCCQGVDCAPVSMPTCSGRPANFCN